MAQDKPINDLDRLTTFSSGDLLPIYHGGSAYAAEAGLFKGDKGDTGDTGPTGPQGATGPQGPQGAPTEVNGKSGASVTLTGSDIAVSETDARTIPEALEDSTNALNPPLTASGSLVTFTSAAAGNPVNPLIVNIEAVQSGSGDPSPDNVRQITGWAGATVTLSPTQDAAGGTVYTISFGSAGTVYGGTLDVARGLLTVSKASIDLGTLTWQKRNDNLFFANVPGMEAPSKNAERNTKILCSQYVPDVQYMVDSMNNNAMLRVSSNIYIHDDAYSDTGTFKTAMDGVTLVYPVAIPLTYQLTPQEVTTLLGTNNLWADCGDVDVTYRAGKNPAVLTVKDIGVAGGAAAYNAVTREMEKLLRIGNGTYQGENLTETFAAEMGSNPWAWIKSRIQAGDFDGININDYIPFTTTNNVTLRACVAGINTYKGYGNTAVGNHIDFICRELWPTLHVANKINFNNGVKFGDAAAVEYPWLASDLYHFINSLSGTVPNAASVGGGAGEAVDYTQGGVYYYLPANLKNVIVEKSAYLPRRYSASGMLSDDNAGGWESIGKLWLPSEYEVYGAPVWGGNGGYATMGNCVQYPLFAHNMNRIKHCNGSRRYWWVLSAYSGNTTYWCSVANSGDASYYSAAYTTIAAPVCFRIA